MMAATCLAAVLVAAAPADLSCEHMGPCVVWAAETDAGAAFLKALPARFRSPEVKAEGGKETPTGRRAEYDPATRSVATCPALQTELRRLAAAANLTATP
jgi:hypothetical protein